MLNENTDSSKKNDTNELVYKIEIISETLRRSLWLLVGGRGGMEEGMVKEFEMDRNTLLYLKWVTTKDLLYSTGNSAQCYVAAWMGVGGFWGEWILG